MSLSVANSRMVAWSELRAPLSPIELERADLRRLCRKIGQESESGGEPALFVRGNLPTTPAVAVVGTRGPTGAAIDFTREIVASIARAGLAIVSGGARGIDHAAHAAALDHGAPTLVVLACGLDVTYPPEHAELYREVVAGGGGLVSLWPDGTAPRQFQFLQRNRLLAALCAALVVVQAPSRSGARSAASAARKLGRPVCAVPHCPWDERGAGCAEELALGAHPIVRAHDVLRALGGPLGARLGAAQPPRPPAPAPVGTSGAGREAQSHQAVTLPVPANRHPPLNDKECHIIKLLDSSPRHQDDVCERARRPFGEVVATLLTLTLRAVVVEGPAAHYRLAPR